MRDARAQLEQLQRIAEALFERESRKLSQIRAKQSDIQSKRSQLEQMNAEALKDLEGLHPAHWHDGEVLWQKWVGRNKRSLGIEEARLRALEEMHKPELRKSFGRKEVIRALQESRHKPDTSYG